MPKILITGNGFDLNFGLPTLYSDFIQILNFIQIEILTRNRNLIITHIKSDELKHELDTSISKIIMSSLSTH